MKKYFTLVSAFLLFPAVSSAALITFEADYTSIAPGQDFLVHVFLDTEGESVNAVSGAIAFPSSIVSLKEIRDGNSVINFWIENPETNRVKGNASQGAIEFSGITTGGISGERELLFSAVFRSEESGAGVLTASQMTILKNDGEGNEVAAKVEPLSLTVAEGSNIFPTALLEVQDDISPEAFMPEISQDPHVLGGKYFLVFATQDKGVGIDHYEVKEGRWGKSYIAESPYELRDQSLSKDIYVKAIDKKGNERIMVMEASRSLKWYPWLAIAGIIIGAIAIIWQLKKVWQKNIRL